MHGENTPQRLFAALAVAEERNKEKNHHLDRCTRATLARVSALFSMVAQSFQEAFQMRRRING
jgi:hypothetical protein